MTMSDARVLLPELTNNIVANAASLEEATKRPGAVCEVDEETYFYYLEVLPPQLMLGGCFGFAEGASPYVLFWRRGGRFFVRQLTMGETADLATRAGIPLPGDW